MPADLSQFTEPYLLLEQKLKAHGDANFKRLRAARSPHRIRPLSDHCPGHAILVELTDKVLSAFTREKLDIHETASLVRYAIRKGLIEP